MCSFTASVYENVLISGGKTKKQLSNLLQFSDSFQKNQGYVLAGNKINVSSLHDYFAPVDSNGFAIKYVKQGKERYKVNGELYEVGPGQYLLLNGHQQGSVEIDTPINTKGICINISQPLIEQVISFKRKPDSTEADPGLSKFLYSKEFLDNCYQSENNLGKILESIGNTVAMEDLHPSDINDEFFMTLAEAIVEDQSKVYRQLQSIPVMKQSAKNDLYKRIQKGRVYIDQHFCEAINTELIAREAAMSQFHFFRLFKTIFQLSPYQYMLNKRLDLAKNLLIEEESVSNTAIEAGFSDVYSFSKAFKKRFGISPSQVNSK